MLSRYCHLMLNPKKVTILQLLKYIKVFIINMQENIGIFIQELFIFTTQILEPIELLLLKVCFCRQIFFKYLQVLWDPYMERKHPDSLGNSDPPSLQHETYLSTQGGIVTGGSDLRYIFQLVTTQGRGGATGGLRLQHCAFCICLGN